MARFEVVGPAGPIPKLVFLAHSDSKVADLLELLNGGDLSSWPGLYRIFEVIQSDLGSNKPGRDAIVSNGWATQDQIERFRFSANSPKTSGLKARHGDETATHAPKGFHLSPMPVSEARDLIKRILSSWLEVKKAVSSTP
jgi:hypothetical protein